MGNCSNIFGFSRIYEPIFEYIWLSKNLRMNIQIYLYWRNGTNTNMNNIQGPFYLNISIFENLCSSLQYGLRWLESISQRWGPGLR